MSGKAATLQSGVRLADYLSTGLLARLCPPDKVAAALSACGRQSQRQRDLPAHATAYYVMALALYQGVNYSEVLRVVTEGMQMLGDDAVRPDVGKSGISAARTRLGWQAMAHFAGQVFVPLADECAPGAFITGLTKRCRLVSKKTQQAAQTRLTTDRRELCRETFSKQTFSKPSIQFAASSPSTELSPPERLVPWWASLINELATYIHTGSKGRNNSLNMGT